MKKMNSRTIKQIVFSGVFLAIALVLPFFTGQIREIGAMLCPMHLPVLLCGYICGGPWGLAVGLIAPVLRSLLFTMPKMIPNAVAMSFELGTYGLVAGIMYKVLPKKNRWIYVSLITAMVAGRIVWGIADWILLSILGREFTLAIFVSGAITSAIPGIILQIVIIPPIVMAMKKAKLVL